MSHVARRYPALRILTISPGGTKGTQAANLQPAPIRVFYNYIDTLTGPMVDQQEIMPALGDQTLQRMASETIYRVLPAGVLQDEDGLKEVRR